MSKGEILEYEDGTKASFLVDFNIKKRELEIKQNEELKEQPSISEGNNFYKIINFVF